MSPEELVQKLNLVEDVTDSRWSGTPKRLWRGSRWGHGVLFADPTGDWNRYDKLLEADIWDPDDPTSPGWHYVESWIEGPYRVVWVNYEFRATFTYCEGDLTLVVCGDEETFNKELADAERFYGPMAG